MSKKRDKVPSLPLIERNAAGIDIGATQIFVAVPADRDAEPVRSFQTFTVELERLADWLHQCQVRTVCIQNDSQKYEFLAQDTLGTQSSVLRMHSESNPAGSARQGTNGGATQLAKASLS